jgi:hypothetical protein
MSLLATFAVLSSRFTLDGHENITIVCSTFVKTPSTRRFAFMHRISH